MPDILRDRIAALNLARKYSVDPKHATPEWLILQPSWMQREEREHADAILAIVRAHMAEPEVVERVAAAMAMNSGAHPASIVFTMLDKTKREAIIASAKAALAAALDGAS
jgi:hypothetical protein